MVTAEKENGQRAFPGPRQQQDEELARLRRKKEVLRQERDRLKSREDILVAEPLLSVPLTSKMRYQFIRDHSRCRILFRVLGVSSSAFYNWKKRGVSARKKQEGELVTQFSQIFKDS